MQQYSTILFDLDNTLFDFDKDEKEAVSKTLLELGIEPTDEVTELYSKINDALWKDFEKGKITKNFLKETRFKSLLCALKKESEKSPLEINDVYAQNLSNGKSLIGGAMQLLQKLKKSGVLLYAVTNGIETTQRKRLEQTGLGKFFCNVFISEAIGFQKPTKEYFDFVLSHIKEKDKEKIILVGDSLTSDIAGAKKAKIKSVWFNRKGKTASPLEKGDFEVHSINELEELLLSL